MTDSEKLKFLESFLGAYKFSSNTKEAEFFCPFCSHHKKKLSINIETDSFQCWTCSKGGKSLFPILKQKNASSHQISQYINKFKSKNVIAKKTLTKEYVITLPKEYQPLVSLGGSISSRRAFKYLESRNVSKDTMLKFKLGYCASGDFSDRIIIPSFDRYGNLNFFTARDLDDNSKSPYLNDVKNMPKGYKNTIIVNELNINFTKPVVIVEGFFDLFNSIDNTIALCGSAVNPDSYLFKTLVTYNTDVILALDPDAFFKKTLYIAKLLKKYDLNVFNVDARPYKDLGKMSKEEVLKRIEAAELVDDHFLFKNRMKSYV